MNNTNDQYQTLNDSLNRKYSTHSECSIEFEVDGPYKAMIIPASKEGVLIKKRYAVFNDDGTLAELKGFEIKRRGELKLIKVFQVFPSSHRPAELKLIKVFQGTPVSERAVPVAIFETDAELIKFHVKKWCKISSYVGIRSIIDWSYYKQSLCSAIQKIVTIPAAMQKVSNPVPRVIHPDWLHKKVCEKEDKFRQRKLVDIFSSKDKDDAKGQRAISDSDNNGMGGQNIEDMEDFRTSEKFSATGPRPTVRCYEVNNGKDSVKRSSQVNSSQPTDHSRSAHEMLKTQQQNDICMKDIDRNSDYPGWLDLKKRKWKEAREKRKRRRLDNAKDRNQSNHTSDVTGTSGGVNQKRTRGKPGFSSYFESEELAPTQCHWQVLWMIMAIQILEELTKNIHVILMRLINQSSPIQEHIGKCRWSLRSIIWLSMLF